MSPIYLHNLPWSFLSFLNLFIYLFLVSLGLCCCVGCSQVVVGRGYSLTGVCGLLIVVGSLVVELGL